MTNPKHSDARKRSWITRKQRYGASGSTAMGLRRRAFARRQRAVSGEQAGKSIAINGVST